MLQSFPIVSTRHLNARAPSAQATSADVLNLTSVEAGLFGWIALMAFAGRPAAKLPLGWSAYRFLVQIGMIIYFAAVCMVKGSPI